ncbi:MAG: hypothetical protein B9J98_02305 [Candidatus Terraquivivens tikiterensis]|uniref:Uncharacterized protein n=1 Tax=Candidatus Terraquivivens tikiterensis TaxID=1980982 RepID=A0A2R7YA92_9ARCH|nr:MAG: hypothetical protein B9J98_02305 [Candidatus Terraquivivens tikiterensis]
MQGLYRKTWGISVMVHEQGERYEGRRRVVKGRKADVLRFREAVGLIIKRRQEALKRKTHPLRVYV